MPNKNAFITWLKAWMDTQGDYTAERLAAEMGNSGAMISKWINGLSIPDARNLLRLAEITGEDPWYLAHMVYDWPMPAPTDKLLKEPGVREIARLVVDLARHSPELVEDLEDLARTMLRRARKRSGKGDAQEGTLPF